MTPLSYSSNLRLALPKGRMLDAVVELLADAGIRVRTSARTYRPSLSAPGFETKLLKPQNIIEMLHAGTRDLGFAGADWVRELGADLVELLDTEFDPVRIVAAAPTELLEDGQLPGRPLVVASEYETLVRSWIEERGLEAELVKTYGATEVFPPEDADVIVDNVSTGATLAANGLVVFDELMTSSTRLYASRHALENDALRARIDDLVLLFRSVLAARERVMFEVNVPAEYLDDVIEVLPSLDRPTVAPLVGNAGFGVKAAVPRDALPHRKWWWLVSLPFN